MLTGPQIGKLRDEIIKIFSLQELAQLLYIRLNERNLEEYAPGAGIKFQVFTILKTASMEDWHNELINALLAERPKNISILNIAYDIGVSINVYDDTSKNKISRAGLEALVNYDPDFNPSEIIQGISHTKRCVCRIQVGNDGEDLFGTGFLVGPDLLLSNYHVFKQVINKPELAAQVKCMFDYEEITGGKVINEGTGVGLDTVNPVLAFSELTTYDETGTPGIDQVEWPEDKLDYALVKLEKDIGNLPFGPNAENAETSKKSEPRGWIKPPVETPKLLKGSHMVIFQHPDKQPIKISIGLSKVQGCDKNKKRVRYLINTLNGSSGSPCFDHKFNWTAMHNMGDQSWNHPYNQGIPASAIIADLGKKGITL